MSEQGQTKKALADLKNVAAMIRAVYRRDGPLPLESDAEALDRAATIFTASLSREAALVEALKELSAWCDSERALLGGVDGYDYRSGEEFGIRRVELQIEKRLLAIRQSQERTSMGAK